MSFFRDQEDRARRTASGARTLSDFDLEIARLLADKVRESRKVMRPIYLKVWGRHVHDMRKVDGYKKSRIRAAMTWYLSHFGDKYVPQAYSADGFRKKFLQIEAAMDRGKEEYTAVEVTADAKRAAGFVDHLGWPKGSKAQLEAACQRVLAAFVKFRSDLRAFCKLHPARTRTGAAVRYVLFAHDLLSSLPGHPADFVDFWMRREFARVGNWDAWSGNLFKQVWDGSLTHPEFVKYVRGLATAYSGNEKDWDKLAEELA